MSANKEATNAASPTPTGDSDSLEKDGIFTPLNMKIHIPILKEPGQFIVFLDEELFLHWWYYNSEYRKQVKGYSEIVLRASSLEATSILLLKGKQLEAFRRVLGESIARLLHDQKPDNARTSLDQAEEFMRARSQEQARVWYLSASLVATLLVIIFGFILWKYRQGIASYWGFGEGGVHVLLGAAMGALGALISVLLRSNKLEIDVSAGRLIHYFEGAVRILLGLMAGLLFSLAVKSDVLLSAINQSEKALTILLVIALIAGASERLLPNLIKQLEGTLVRETEGAKPEGSNQKHVTKIEKQSLKVEQRKEEEIVSSDKKEKEIASPNKEA